jgi:hypothetical protein
VIIGVLFAAGLFAAQVLLTVVLALLIVAGPPLIALSAVPELSHLARTWAHALLATALVPLGWTVLFATAGALCLDATSFTGGATGLPGHVAAAFAGLITFVLAVKLPWMLLGELRRTFASGSLSARGANATTPSRMPGVERVRAAHSRLRSAALDGAPSLGRSVGHAAGALGAPAGGPLGAAGRGLARVARGAGILPATAAAGLATAGATAARGNSQGRKRVKTPGRGRPVRERFATAGVILREAPSEAHLAMARTAQPTSPMDAKNAATRASSSGAGTFTEKRAAREPTLDVPLPPTGRPRSSKAQAARRTQPPGQRQGRQTRTGTQPTARDAADAGRRDTTRKRAPQAQPLRPDSPPVAEPRRDAASASDSTGTGRKISAITPESAEPSERPHAPRVDRPQAQPSPPSQRHSPQTRKPRPRRQS